MHKYDTRAVTHHPGHSREFEAIVMSPILWILIFLSACCCLHNIFASSNLNQLVEKNSLPVLHLHETLNFIWSDRDHVKESGAYPNIDDDDWVDGEISL